MEVEKSAYEKSYDDALEVWDGLDVVRDEPQLESKKSPMHPYYYFHLSQVRGFTEKNGSTYAEYVSKWRSRY
jgi:hypothetical protein